MYKMTQTCYYSCVAHAISTHVNIFDNICTHIDTTISICYVNCQVSIEPATLHVDAH